MVWASVRRYVSCSDAVYSFFFAMVSGRGGKIGKGEGGKQRVASKGGERG